MKNKNDRPMAEGICVWCKSTFIGKRCYILSGRKKCCSASCHGRYARSHQKRLGRKPVHGDSRTPIYDRWRGMVKRCTKPYETAYKNYGAKGVTVCREWETSYVSFRTWALKNGFKKELQIDRIDNAKGHSPENCRWVTPKQQQNNRRNNIKLPSGETPMEASLRLGMTKRAVYQRIKAGVPPELAASMPPGTIFNKRSKLTK